MDSFQVKIEENPKGGHLAQLIEQQPHTLKCKSKRKVPVASRQSLLQKFFLCCLPLKDCADELGLNYSTAKSIVDSHRKRFRQDWWPSLDGEGKRSGWKEGVCDYELISSIGGYRLV